LNSSSTMALSIRRLAGLLPVIALLPVIGLAGCAQLSPLVGMEPPTAKAEPPAICALLEDQGRLRLAIQDARDHWGLEPAVALALLEPPLGGGRKRHVLPYGNTWDEYRIAQSNWSASTDNIDDAVDFLGWAVARNRQMLQLDIHQVDALYLAYRLGPGAYSQGVHRGIWIEKEAQGVAARAERYSEELQSCPELVQPNRWEWQRLWSWW